MMKNIFRFGISLAIAGGFLAACAADPAPSQPEDASTVLTLDASLSDAQTKTSLGTPDGAAFPILWNTGDRISVNGILSNAVEETDNGKESVRFRFEGNLSAPYRVLYPGTTSTNVISLPAVQNYVADSFDPAAAASCGTAEESDGQWGVSLKHFSGLIRFALNGSATLTKIELNSLGTENLYGDFTLATDASGFTGAFTGGTDGTLTYSFGSGLTLSETDTYVYIALPAQAYAKGIEALVYQEDGAFMRLKFWGAGYELNGTDLVAFESKTFAAGRTEHLVAAGELDAEDGGMPDVPAGVTVAVFNTMRFDEEYRPSAAITEINNSKALWRPEGAISSSNEAMREAFGKVIYNTHADIIGFNEVEETMNEYSDENSIEKLAEAQGCNYEYHFFSSSKAGWFEQITGGSGDLSFANGFAYNTDVLTLNDSGRAWYNSSGSTNYSTSSDDNSGSPHRTYIWAKFTHKDSGKQFWFFVTQLPRNTVEHNTNAANGINNFAQSKAGSDPQILVGDMNNANDSGHEYQAGAQKLLEYWTDAYDAVDAAGNLSSFYKTYSGTQSGTGGNYQYTLLDFCKNHPERRIDRIMTKGACTATTYKTIRNTYTVHYTGIGTSVLNGETTEQEVDEDVACYPSDHLAVVSYVTLD